MAWRKFVQLVKTMLHLFMFTLPTGKESSLKMSMTFSTMEVYEYLRQMDRAGKMPTSQR